MFPGACERDRASLLTANDADVLVSYGSRPVDLVLSAVGPQVRVAHAGGGEPDDGCGRVFTTRASREISSGRRRPARSDTGPPASWPSATPASRAASAPSDPNREPRTSRCQRLYARLALQRGSCRACQARAAVAGSGSPVKDNRRDLQDRCLPPVRRRGSRLLPRTRCRPARRDLGVRCCRLLSLAVSLLCLRLRCPASTCPSRACPDLPHT